jgi:transmembrane sensor
MSEIVKLRTRAEIDEEAAIWVWRMDSGAPGDADTESFEAWLRQDPRHRRAYDELTKVWETLDGLPDPHRTLQLPALSESAEPVAALTPRGGRSYWWVALAATILAAVSGATWLLYKGNETQILATAVGQHRNITLSDGTIVALNTNTIVDTSFSRDTREIFLRKGEAHFGVAQDRSRPFLVHAGDAVVRAIGTAFEVRLRADKHVDVLVNEGRVEVHSTGESAAAIPVVTVRAVSAGEQLSTATTNYAVVPVSAEQVSSELAWRDGAVVFDSAPLSEAIAEIQRYTDARIIVSDATIGTLPVGGRFKTDDLQGFLDGLEAALPVRIRRASDGLVYVDPRH